MIQIDKIKVYENYSIRKAVQIMDHGGIGFIYAVNDNNKITGVVSDGDFRRAVLKGVSLDDGIHTIMNRYFISLNENYKNEEAEKIFRETVVRYIPVLLDRVVVGIIAEEDMDKLEKTRKNATIDLPVVIMAGGFGTRLDPFTRILPKPLIPMGDKTMAEVIIDRFRNFGVDHFYLSINHKAKIIKSYFDELLCDYQLTYLYEDKPLGTAGSLRQLYEQIEGAFIVTNCDIIVETDYGDLVKHHFERENDISLVASVKQYCIPYGICTMEDGGMLVGIEEKPEYDFLVNTGMYVMDASVLKLIPDNEVFHMTDLIGRVKNTGGRVGVYPVSERSWVDTGQWVEYKKAVEKMGV